MKKSVEGLKTSKITGGIRHPLKTRRKFQMDRYPNEALMGDQETATRKTRGNNRNENLRNDFMSPGLFGRSPAPAIFFAMRQLPPGSESSSGHVPSAMIEVARSAS